MQVTETLAEGLKRELKVVIPASELASRLDAYLEDLKGKVNIKGFRPGKVPAGHLKRLYGRQATAEILNEMLTESTRKAVEERNEKPALQPEIDLPEGEAERILNGEADLAFTMSYDLLPEFEVIDFKTIEIERPIVEIDESEVDEQIQQIAENNKPFETKDGPPPMATVSS